MNEMANELRAFVEQTNQTLMSQNKRLHQSNQGLLKALLNMRNSINNLRNKSSHGRDISSNEPDINESSSSRIPRPTFLQREEVQMEEEGINQPTNNTVENARVYASLEPEIRELIRFCGI